LNVYRTTLLTLFYLEPITSKKTPNANQSERSVIMNRRDSTFA